MIFFAYFVVRYTELIYPFDTEIDFITRDHIEIERLCTISKGFLLRILTKD